MSCKIHCVGSLGGENMQLGWNSYSLTSSSHRHFPNRLDFFKPLNLLSHVSRSRDSRLSLGLHLGRAGCARPFCPKKLKHHDNLSEHMNSLPMQKYCCRGGRLRHAFLGARSIAEEQKKPSSKPSFAKRTEVAAASRVLLMSRKVANRPGNENLAGRVDNRTRAIAVGQPIGRPSTASRGPEPPAYQKALQVIREQLLKQSLDPKNHSGAFEKPLEADEAAAVRTKYQEQRLEGLAAAGEDRGRSGGGPASSVPGAFRAAAALGAGLPPRGAPIDPATLVEGEYVVHRRVGIGRFVGLKWEVPPGKHEEAMYVYLQYADGLAKLKASQATKLLYRYRSLRKETRAPVLGKLRDTTQWEKRKSKGQQTIQKLVVNMMELYAHRLKQKREPYPPDDPALLEAFCGDFPHQPTPDQQQAFRDVARDMMERETPMDRLICGDVGFGKTEVALRAVFRAVMAGRQVMVLAPTTILAKQHFNVIRDRFAAYPGVSVALLSRFQKETEKREVILGIQEGTLKIIVGTHALLGKHVQYHNLGLLVVDEEQRFGVRQKERITSLKTTVDVLTLSATPIPRTLYLALSGFRDASLITTPPPERRAIKTHLEELEMSRVLHAIRTELDRGGQVYYVVPRVKGIEERKKFLLENLRGVTVSVAHGKVNSDELEEAMERFSEGETDVLLCTSIIESGLDVSAVNTIVIEDVHMFGLAQLYQLRGRVGRADKEAHAYLFHPLKELLSDEALERLVALEECCGLGQGFHIAERDMAIRGIGNVFGEKQSGEVARIGVDLYLEMLYDSLSRVEDLNLPRVEFEDVELEVDIDMYLPPEYVAEASDRARFVRDTEQAARNGMRALVIFTDTAREQLGPEPPSVQALLKATYVRRIASDLGIHRVRAKGRTVLMETEMEEGAFDVLSRTVTTPSIRDSLSFRPGHIELRALINLPPSRQLERVFLCLAEMRNALPSFVRYI